MKFKYTLTFADFLMLNKRIFLRDRNFKILSIISILFILVYIFFPLAYHHQHHEISIGRIYLRNIYLLIMPLLVAYLFIRVPFRIRKAWNVSAALRLEKTYDFSDAGIRVTATGIDSLIGWQYIAQAEIWRGWLFVMTNQRMFYLFPLSAVPEPDKLISMLAAKIGNVKGMKHA